MHESIILPAVICCGHRGASGTGPNFGNTCEGGSIRAQDPVFVKNGFNLRDYLKSEPFYGTLNCYIGNNLVDPLSYIHEINEDPNRFLPDREFDPARTQWDYKLFNIKWDEKWPPENFSFLKGHLIFESKIYPCFVYFPDPSTKPNNIIPTTILEVIAPPIAFPAGLIYGQKVVLQFPKDRLAMKPAPQKP